MTFGPSLLALSLLTGTVEAQEAPEADVSEQAVSPEEAPLQNDRLTFSTDLTLALATKELALPSASWGAQSYLGLNAGPCQIKAVSNLGPIITGERPPIYVAQLGCHGPNERTTIMGGKIVAPVWLLNPYIPFLRDMREAAYAGSTFVPRSPFVTPGLKITHELPDGGGEKLLHLELALIQGRELVNVRPLELTGSATIYFPKEVGSFGMAFAGNGHGMAMGLDTHWKLRQLGLDAYLLAEEPYTSQYPHPETVMGGIGLHRRIELGSTTLTPYTRFDRSSVEAFEGEDAQRNAELQVGLRGDFAIHDIPVIMKGGYQHGWGSESWGQGTLSFTVPFEFQH